MSNQSYTLFALNEQIRRAIALNFADGVWVSAEIAQVNENKGHTYLQIVEKEENGKRLIAQSAAMIWQKDYRQLHKKLRSTLEGLLQIGNHILFLAQVSFDERYGMTLFIKDIDPVFTLGQLELAKQKTVEQLKQEGLLDKNAGLPSPLVWQRVAVLSSPTAAGYEDFMGQLNYNAYGYAFHTDLFPIAVQGREVERDFLKQMNRVLRQHHNYDCIVVIRGGGAKIDLAAFDSLEIGRCIAGSALPVVTGIGHEVDHSVADLVAHSQLKTPTAAAEFLILQNLRFEQSVLNLGLGLQKLIGHHLREAFLQLAAVERDFINAAGNLLLNRKKELENVKNEISYLLKRKLSDSHKELEHLATLVKLLDPQATLARGFTLTIKDGKAVNSVEELKKGDKILTKFFDGEKYSILE